MKKNRLFVLIFGVLFSLSAFSHDGLTEQESRYLVHVTQELTYLQRLVEQARHYRNPTAMVQVDYDALQADLKTIKRHLVRHIESPSRVPRQLPPLQSAL